MNVKTILGFLLIASFAVYGDINTVTVPAGMLHLPDAGMQLGFSGKVEYTLTTGGYDSVFVTLRILSVPDSTPLALTEVSGDVGLIHIGNAAGSEKHAIFFQSAAPANTQYVAQIHATADSSAMKKEIEGFIATMLKGDKASLTGGGGDGFEGKGAGPIPQIWMSDGPHGVRPPTGGQATAFPTMAGLACTWDTAMAFTEGQMMGEEFRALGKNCALGPAYDLVYHPQGGRASEYLSEDPFLSGRMAASDVRGLQSRGVMATSKHFACNNKETNRFNLSANMSERSIRELYLYNWKPAIVDAGCLGIMGAYNKVNHSYACSNKYLMTDVLRNEWGYRSLVMTDWGASFDNITAGMQYGADIDMPSPDTYSPGAVAGQPDSIVNMHARRIIYAHEMIGDLKAGYNKTDYATTLMSQAHRDSVKALGAAGIVLAKNTGNILPLPKTGKTVACTGPFYTQCRLGPGGSSAVNARDRVNPQQGIIALLAAVGVGATTITTDLNAADYIIVFVGVNGEQEGGDRPNLAIQPGDGETAVQAALSAVNGETKTIVVFTGGSAASNGIWSTAPAILIAFYPGQEQGTSIANILFGNTVPSGKLPVTFPQDATQLPNFNLAGADLNYPAADTAHGYFRVNKMNVEPLFNFGHGLSYTTFSYSNLQIFPAQISAGDRVRVRATVTNTGTVWTAKEVVQLYLSMPTTNAALPVRVQDLRGFKKVSLAPGASTTVEFVLTPEEMQIFNPNGTDYSGTGTWQVLAGTYGVRVATSSQRDLPATLSLSGSFTVQQ
jgi:beta-glucosidase